MGGEHTEQAILDAIKVMFPDWEPFKGVGDVGWYARRPKSSPPKVVGPVPLERLAAAIAEKVGW